MRVVVRVEVVEVEVQRGGGDVVGGGDVGPLRHAGEAEGMVALGEDGVVDEEVADGAEVVVCDGFCGGGGGGHAGRGR